MGGHLYFFSLTVGRTIHSAWGCPRGVMVKAMDCGTVVSEFVLQSRYYVHFRANTLGKGMNPLIPKVYMPLNKDMTDLFCTSSTKCALCHLLTGLYSMMARFGSTVHLLPIYIYIYIYHKAFVNTHLVSYKKKKTLYDICINPILLSRAERCTRFELRVFFLLGWLPNQG